MVSDVNLHPYVEGLLNGFNVPFQSKRAILEIGLAPQGGAAEVRRGKKNCVVVCLLFHEGTHSSNSVEGKGPPSRSILMCSNSGGGRTCLIF